MYSVWIASGQPTDKENATVSYRIGRRTDSGWLQVPEKEADLLEVLFLNLGNQKAVRDEEHPGILWLPDVLFSTLEIRDRTLLADGISTELSEDAFAASEEAADDRTIAMKQWLLQTRSRAAGTFGSTYVLFQTFAHLPLRGGRGGIGSTGRCASPVAGSCWTLPQPLRTEVQVWSSVVSLMGSQKRCSPRSEAHGDVRIPFSAPEERCAAHCSSGLPRVWQ